MDWFRSHHGAPSDSKWLVIARKAKVQPAAVVAVFWSLLDYASQQESRGDIEGFDPESVAAFLGIEDDEIAAIMIAFEDKGITEHGRIANWDKRQPKREREDNSVARVQRHRETRSTTANDVTPCNATVTPCNATDNQETPRLDKRREEEIIFPLTPVEQEAQITTINGKVFSECDPLPTHTENYLRESCPDWWEAHLRLALVARQFTNTVALDSYAMQILRGWKRGKDTPQAPIPDVPIHAAPPDTLLPPGARIISMAERRAKRAAQEATHATQ